MLSFLVFQDDVLEISVGAYAQKIMEEVKSQLICGELDFEPCEKPEANLPFSITFEFIGAEFITAYPAPIIRLPAKHLRAATVADTQWILNNAGKLVPNTLLQVGIGRLTFCSFFVQFGRVILNSSYSALGGAQFLNFQHENAMMAAEMATEFKALQEKKCNASNGRRPSSRPKFSSRDTGYLFQCGDFTRRMMGSKCV